MAYEKFEKFVVNYGGTFIPLSNGAYIVKFPEQDSAKPARDEKQPVRSGKPPREEKVAPTTTQGKVSAALREVGFDLDLSKHWESLVTGESCPLDKSIAKYLAEILEVDYAEVMKDCRKLGVTPFHLLLAAYDIPCRGTTASIKKAESYFSSDDDADDADADDDGDGYDDGDDADSDDADSDDADSDDDDGDDADSDDDDVLPIRRPRTRK